VSVPELFQAALTASPPPETVPDISALTSNLYMFANGLTETSFDGLKL
jgi:hypothetical protein